MSLQSHIHELEEKHRTLDRTIAQEMARPHSDETRVRELKKKKLHLKEELERLRGRSISVH